MKRKLIAAWRLITSRGYILCTIKDDGNKLFYDHNVVQENVIRYNSYINQIYIGELEALRKAKEILEDY